MATVPFMSLLKISQSISYVAVFLALFTLPHTLRAADPVRPSYLDGMVRDYFQKWEDSLQGGFANETVFEMTEIDKTFNSATKKIIKIQFQRKKKNNNYKPGGYSTQFQMELNNQVIFNVLKTNPNSSLEPAAFTPPTKEQLKNTNLTDVVRISRKNSSHPGPLPCE